MVKNERGLQFDNDKAVELARMIRKSASLSLSKVTETLESNILDLSLSYAEILGALLDCVTNTDLLERSSRSIAAIFRCCSSSEARIAFVAKVSATYPRFGQQSIDLSAASVLAHMCGSVDCVETSVCQSLLTAAISVSLVKQLKISPSEDVKCKIVEAVGSLARLVVASDQPVPGILKDDLVSVLGDKKTSDRAKEAAILALEACTAADKNSRISSAVISFDVIAPFLTRLVEGRQTARVSCLAAWCIALHALAEEKKLYPIFSQCANSDLTFGPVLGEDSAIVRRLLRSVAIAAVKIEALALFGKSEVETITFPSKSEKMKNRFPINLIKIIGATSFTSFEFPASLAAEFANRLVLALYELVVTKGLPGNLARVALKKVASVCGKMDSDSIALLLVLAHHPLFASHRVSPAKVWKQLACPSHIIEKSLKSISGMIFQGASLPVHDSSGFRDACLYSVETLASLHMVSEVMDEAVKRVKLCGIGAQTEADVSVFFCSEKVVWNQDEDLCWIPTEANTISPPPKVSIAKASSGITKEDMLRAALKEQAMTRSRVGSVANNARFCLDVIAIRSAEYSKLIGEKISDSMSEMMLLLKSPLTSESAKKVVEHAVESVVSSAVVDSNLIPPLLTQVAQNEISFENWVSFFESVSDSQAMTAAEFNLTLPLFKHALNGEHIDAESAHAALAALARQTDLPLLPVLDLVRGVARISPGPFASSIGRLLRQVSVKLRYREEVDNFCDIAITDDEKLFIEFMAALNLVFPSVLGDFPRLQAFVVMGASEATKSRIEEIDLADFKIVSALMQMLKTEPLVQRKAAQALSFICSAPGASMSTLNRILSFCEAAMISSEEKNEEIGFALALGEIGKVPLANDIEFLSSFLRFVLGTAMVRPDLAEPVRDALLVAVQETVSTHGQNHAVNLLSVTEEFIGLKQQAAALCVPIILGLLTKHLSPTDEKVSSVRTKLVAELLTAAQPEVQVKISIVLPPLLKMSEDVPKYLETFLNTALSSLDAQARYGAALGVGAASKAQGVGILRQMEVLKKLQETLESKQSSHESRQGAISVYGGLSLALGRLFEPYVSQVLPVLLVAFSDGNAGVREASNVAASQIMANLSTHGIKLVLPSLLKGVDDLQWRTKLGSIKLLTAMLNCAPKQLATCLPKVVPALSEAATDTHSKVKEAACASLQQVAKVIGNPEIRNCAHKLIASLTDPANDLLRQEALDVLLSTSFVHSLDAASLALVIPVMLRATRERRSEIKRKGAQILGSIAVLSADPTEGLGPYMDRIIPALENVLIDPIPDVRTTAAKALGTMARAVPDMIVAQVMPWLFSTLKEAESQVERSGAAQGLSEVLVELGADQFEKILPDVVANAVSMDTNPEAREGYMGLFVFLPSVMRAAFTPFIETVFPVLILGLSDLLQPVREVALRAASSICAQFASTNATLLMPSLEKGLFARDWRARQASVQLVGITLEHLMKSARGNKDNLLESQVPLTQERRSYMLGMLYIVRSDPNQAASHSAQSVWKNVVSNTPRTLRLILPILVRLIISNLSADETRQSLAGRCLGDLVGKLGDRVLPDLMPILTENIHSDDVSVRSGVCVGLTHIVHAAHRQLLQEFFSIMFPALRIALCDESALVRAKAGETVAVLHKELGNTAINNTLPHILEEIDRESSASAFGIEQLLTVLSKDLLSQVVDALTADPVTANRLHALEKISVAPQLEVAKFASRIVAFLMTSHEAFPEECMHAANALFASFNRHSSHLCLIELVRGLGDPQSGKMREAAAGLSAAAFRGAALEVLAEYMSTLVPALTRAVLSDPYQPAMEASLLALGELTNKVSKETMMKYMHEICGTVQREVTGGGQSGLALPKTFETLWPLYQQALMFGNQDVREMAAKGLVVLVENTPNDRLKPNAIKVTGPLIRVLGDRYPANIRVCLLQTLKVLLQRLESALKPFLPQLQTTYQKCAQDPDEAVKTLAEESQLLLLRVTGVKA